jgi:predicted dehydrogenase
LGQVHRIFWTLTDQFRTDGYYRSAGWRGSWTGEGGGVMTNQCPHDLDLWQWLFGMPVRVRGFCGFGKRHLLIDVEDEVTAYLEYADGATGVLLCGTGEAPGTSRLEVAAEHGRVVVERGRIHFTRNEVPSSHFLRTSMDAYAGPPSWEIEVPVTGQGGTHVWTIQDFVDAILDSRAPCVSGEEGARSVELANAILESSLAGRTIELPLDASAFESRLKGLIASSRA